MFQLPTGGIMSKRVMQMAYDALEMQIHGAGSIIHSKIAWGALKTELTKSEPEPVAWMHPIYTSLIEPHKFDPDCIPLFRKEDV